MLQTDIAGWKNQQRQDHPHRNNTHNHKRYDDNSPVFSLMQHFYLLPEGNKIRKKSLTLHGSTSLITVTTLAKQFRLSRLLFISLLLYLKRCNPLIDRRVSAQKL